MRDLVPADSLVYLETNDLAGALQPIIDSKPFNEVAKSKPDLSALKGVQLAVAVTGFETSEEKVNDEQSIGRIQPRFVAIADTHAFHFQAVGFAEQKLGSFVAKIYDSEPTIEKSEKKGGKYFIWTAQDGRKAYALVIDSLIYFGNDESAIEKCLVVRRGETDNIAKTGKIQPTDPQTLASGYVSTDGIAQIANIIGLKFASETSEDSEIQSAIAGILPQLLRNSITEISWKSHIQSGRIVDEYAIALKPDLSAAFKKNLTQPGGWSEFQQTDFEDFIPANSASITRYIFPQPLLAWQTLVSSASQLIETRYLPFVGTIAASDFASYGIEDADSFLGSIVDQRILTARLDQEGDEKVLITKVRDMEKLKPFFSKDIDFSRPAEPVGDALLWKSSDSDIAIATIKAKVLKDDTNYVDEVVIGDRDAVAKCLNAKSTGNDFTKSERYYEQEFNGAAVLTITTEIDPDAGLVELLSSKKTSAPLKQLTFTKTWFDDGIQRNTMSDLGLIGSIIAQLGKD